MTPRPAVYGVYRARHEREMTALLRPARRHRWDVALWALDEPVSSLERVTYGSGPGTKFDLLNELLRLRPPRDGAYVVVTDDDFVFTRGGLPDLLRLVRRAGFGLAQPAHDEGSLASHKINRVRAGSVARLTTFVEIGPVFVVAPEWRDAVLPFPDDVGMGWGIELDWSRLTERGARLGIVDAVRLRHLVKPGTGYDAEAALAEMYERWAAHGVTQWSDVQRELAVWTEGARRPPWDVR